MKNADAKRDEQHLGTVELVRMVSLCGRRKKSPRSTSTKVVEVKPSPSSSPSVRFGCALSLVLVRFDEGMFFDL